MAESSEMRLARLIRARREWLDTNEEAPAPAGTDWIDTPRSRPFLQDTFDQIETSLHWRPGTVEKIRDGKLTKNQEEALVTAPVRRDDPRIAR